MSKQNSKQKRKKQLPAITGFVIVMLVIIVIVLGFYFYFKDKKEERLSYIDRELENLKYQLWIKTKLKDRIDRIAHKTYLITINVAFAFILLINYIWYQSLPSNGNTFKLLFFMFERNIGVLTLLFVPTWFLKNSFDITKLKRFIRYKISEHFYSEHPTLKMDIFNIEERINLLLKEKAEIQSTLVMQ